MLLKMLPVRIFGPNAAIDTHAILDEASTVTLIDQNLARSVGLKGPRLNLALRGINSHESVTLVSEKVKFEIMGSFAKHNVINAITKRNLELPSQTVPYELTEHVLASKNIELRPFTNSRPQLLIGQDNWPLIITREFRELDKSLCLSRSLLGWTVHGYFSIENPVNSSLCICSEESVSDDKIIEPIEPLDDLMKQYFLLDNFGIGDAIPSKNKHEHSLKILERSSKRI